MVWCRLLRRQWLCPSFQCFGEHGLLLGVNLKSESLWKSRGPSLSEAHGGAGLAMPAASQDLIGFADLVRDVWLAEVRALGK